MMTWQIAEAEGNTVTYDTRKTQLCSTDLQKPFTSQVWMKTWEFQCDMETQHYNPDNGTQELRSYSLEM